MTLTLIIAAVVLALAVLAMGAAALFSRRGRFPDGEISHSAELRRRGIVCAKEEEMRLWRKNKKAGIPACPEGGCDGCAFYTSDSSESSTRS
ncbi:MAG: hypothetical protein IKR30_02675 [Bacteroidales bacterium]|nr:hypothetical protein [Bacteroidales bacterium]